MKNKSNVVYRAIFLPTFPLANSLLSILNCFFVIQELVQQREKSTSEIADLESIAQAHYSRANRISEELHYLREEYIEVKRKV